MNSNSFKYNPDEDESANLLRHWNTVCRYPEALCVVCDKCGDTTPSFCRCARERWMNETKMNYRINQRLSPTYLEPPKIDESKCSICEKNTDDPVFHKKPGKKDLKTYCWACIAIIAKHNQ